MRGAGLSLDGTGGEILRNLVANMPDAFVDAIRRSEAPLAAQQRLLGSGMIERISQSCDVAREALA